MGRVGMTQTNSLRYVARIVFLKPSPKMRHVQVNSTTRGEIMLAKRFINHTLAICLFIGLAVILSNGQTSKRSAAMNCSDGSFSDDLESYCAMREQTLPASSALDVDGKMNGSVAISGWDRNEILVRM